MRELHDTRFSLSAIRYVSVCAHKPAALDQMRAHLQQATCRSHLFMDAGLHRLFAP